MLAVEQSRLDPFGEFGRALQRPERQFAHPPVGDAFGQGIDALAKRDLGRPARIEHLRMDDLPLVAIGLELAGHGARLVQRELLLRPARIVEEN